MEVELVWLVRSVTSEWDKGFPNVMTAAQTVQTYTDYTDCTDYTMVEAVYRVRREKNEQK